jgi:CRP-like cAMP-binding protein
MGDVMMEAEARSVRMGSVAAHPLAELLDCPADAGNLLNGSAQSLDVAAGDAVFRQDDLCRGLYVVVSGLFVRKAERLNTRLTLGPARTGDLVELAAALGDGRHTYTLSAQSAGSVLLLPMEALNKVFEKYPPLRMRLLEELAREVSRAYLSCCLNRAVHTRRREGSVELA